MSEYNANPAGAPAQNVPAQNVAGQNVPAQDTLGAAQQVSPPNGQAAPQNAAAQSAPVQTNAGQAAAGQGVPAQETIGAGTPQPQGDNTLQRNPDEWATGDEPMTEAQKSYLDTLARENGEQLPANLTKAEASKQIDRLQKGSPRTAQ